VKLVSVLILFVIWSSSLSVNVAQAQTTVYYTVASDGSAKYRDIQSAINAVPSGVYGDIHVKAGTYVPVYKAASDRSGGAYIYLKSNLYIHGDGIGKTILTRGRTYGSTSNIDMFGNTVPLTNVIIEGMTLNGMSGPSVSKILNGYGSGINLSHNRAIKNTRIVIRSVEALNWGCGFAGRNIIGTDFESNFGLLLENCHTSNGWTSSTFINSAFVIIKNNRFEKTAGARSSGGMGGDAIFPQATTSYRPSGTSGLSHDWIVTGNYVYNIGDTGFDATTANGMPPEYNFLFEGNTMVNAFLRSSGSKNVIIRGNSFYDSTTGTYKKAGIGFDSGKGKPIDVLIEGNTVTSSRTTGISLSCADSGASKILGLDDAYRSSGTIVKNNVVKMLNGGRGLVITCTGDVFSSGNTVNGRPV
jgi:hypothetical protein